MQTTRRWERSEQQSCDRLAEVSSDHAVCGLTGLWCPRLQTAHFTGCPQQCRAHYKHSDEAEQQPGRSFKLNFIISGLRILVLEQHTALLWAPFQQASPRSFSSSWQYIQQSTAAQDTCAGTKPFQLKATYVSEPTPAHEVADRSSASRYPQLSLICITSTPILKGILWRYHHDAKLYFSITERSWLLWSKAQIT